MSATKVCLICKIEKPLEEFHLDRCKKDGRRSYCKVCSRRRARERHERIKRMPKPEVISKRCPGCGQIKSREEYCNLKSRKDGISTYCRDCRKIKLADAYKKREPRKPTVDHKICSVCGQNKMASEFYRAPKRKDGLSYDCKCCRIKRTQRWCKDNPEKYRALNKRKLEAHVRSGKHKEYSRRWWKKHPDKMKEYDRKWYKKHGLIRDQRRRMRKNALPFDFTREDLADTYMMFDSECGFCGTKENLTMEHVIPISRTDIENPGTVRGNLMPLCLSCNSSKSTKLLDEYFADDKNLLPAIRVHMEERGVDAEELVLRIKYRLGMLARG